LKWVLVKDPYYDPLLTFTGFRRVDTLEDKTITIWSKEGTPPAVPMNTALIPPHWQGLMWGTLPFGSSILALLVLLIPEERRPNGKEAGISAVSEDLEPGRLAI
jgi:hypothetical protein